MTKNQPQAVLRHSDPEIKSTLTIDIPRDYVAEVFIPGDSGDEDCVQPYVVVQQSRDGRHVIRVIDSSEIMDLQIDDSFADVGILTMTRSTYQKIASWLAAHVDGIIDESDAYQRYRSSNRRLAPWTLPVYFEDGPKENLTYEPLKELADKLTAYFEEDLDEAMTVDKTLRVIEIGRQNGGDWFSEGLEAQATKLHEAASEGVTE